MNLNPNEYRYYVSRPDELPLGILHPEFHAVIDGYASVGHFVCSQLLFYNKSLVQTINRSNRPFDLTLKIIGDHIRLWIEQFVVETIKANSDIKTAQFPKVYLNEYAYFKINKKFITDIIQRNFPNLKISFNDKCYEVGCYNVCKYIRGRALYDMFIDINEFLFYNLSNMFGFIKSVKGTYKRELKENGFEEMIHRNISSQLAVLVKEFLLSPIVYIRYVISNACKVAFEKLMTSPNADLKGVENILVHVRRHSTPVIIETDTDNELQIQTERELTYLINETYFISKIRLDSNIRILDKQYIDSTSSRYSFAYAKIIAFRDFVDVFDQFEPQNNIDLKTKFITGIVSSCDVQKPSDAIILPWPTQVPIHDVDYDTNYKVWTFMMVLLDLSAGKSTEKFIVKNITTKQILRAITNLYEYIEQFKEVDLFERSDILLLGNMLGLRYTYALLECPLYVATEIKKLLQMDDDHTLLFDLVYTLLHQSYEDNNISASRIRSRIDFFS